MKTFIEVSAPVLFVNQVWPYWRYIIEIEGYIIKVGCIIYPFYEKVFRLDESVGFVLYGQHSIDLQKDTLFRTKTAEDDQ